MIPTINISTVALTITVLYVIISMVGVMLQYNKQFRKTNLKSKT